MDGLALREEVRVLPARRLAGVQELESAGGGGGGKPYSNVQRGACTTCVMRQRLVL